MNGARIDCGKKITDSLIGKDVEILDSAQRLPEGRRLIVEDSSKVARALLLGNENSGYSHVLIYRDIHLILSPNIVSRPAAEFEA